VTYSGPNTSLVVFSSGEPPKSTKSRCGGVALLGRKDLQRYIERVDVLEAGYVLAIVYMYIPIAKVLFDGSRPYGSSLS